jgi:hypothetical protein
METCIDLDVKTLDMETCIDLDVKNKRFFKLKTHRRYIDF